MNSWRIAVLCGGASEEREVSFATAAMVVPALRELGHLVHVVDTSRGFLTEAQEAESLARGGALAKSGEWAVRRGPEMFPMELFRSRSDRQIDLVFVALHGGSGEDGTIQGVLELAGIPFTGSGHAASAVCMDKDLSKRLLRGSGIGTPDWVTIQRGERWDSLGLDYPLVVKPNRQGSTIGLSLVRDSSALSAALAKAFDFDDEVMIERFVPGREFTVGVLEGRALAVGEIIIRPDSVFGYDAKYSPGIVFEKFPADVAPALARDLRQAAVSAHRVLKLRDYSRADFRLDDAGRIWCLEVNSLPGLTTSSLLPQSALACGIPFKRLCQRLCELAMLRITPGSEGR